MRHFHSVLEWCVYFHSGLSLRLFNVVYLDCTHCNYSLAIKIYQKEFLPPLPILHQIAIILMAIRCGNDTGLLCGTGSCSYHDIIFNLPLISEHWRHFYDCFIMFIYTLIMFISSARRFVCITYIQWDTRLVGYTFPSFLLKWAYPGNPHVYHHCASTAPSLNHHRTIALWH